jgi:very-short-patch-repair endonuclease
MALTEQKRLAQARRLRRAQTPAETRLWSGLRGRRLQNYKFARQYPVGPFTVDFLCREAHLVVEVMAPRTLLIPKSPMMSEERPI